MQKIEGNVTAVQVAIWNKGKREIASTDILKNIEVYLDPQVPILDAEIRQRTREDIIQMEIDKTKYRLGIIPVTWKILENEDGGLLQIIYLGKPDVRIRMRGALIGQRAIREIKSPIQIQSAFQQISETRLMRKVLVATVLFIIISGIFLNVIERRDRKKGLQLDKAFREYLEKSRDQKDLARILERRKPNLMLNAITFAIFITSLVMIWFVFRYQMKSPFGF